MANLRLNLSDVLSLMEPVGLFAYAISGIIEARQHRLDIVGIFVAAFLTAFGGGTIRDLLLDRRPFYWDEHQGYVLVIFVLALFTPFIFRTMSRVLTERVLLIADGIGLGLFSISGTSIALEKGQPMFASVMIGIITAVCGGILRDILCNEIPIVLRDSKPYAACSFLGCWIYIAMVQIHIDTDISAAVAAGLILVTRLVTYQFEIKLPR